MKIIFLDIDGVLNCQKTEARCGCFIGIDKSKVKQLRRIFDATNAKIVLSSSWKSGWERVNKELQDREGNYLDRRLRDEGMLILDKTDDIWGSSHRGKSIKHWMSQLPEGKIEQFVILDDEVFDYAAEGLLPHLVQTSFYSDCGGLTDECVELAIKVLNDGPSATQPVPSGFVVCSKCIHFDECDYKESRDGCYLGEEEG